MKVSRGRHDGQFQRAWGRKVPWPRCVSAVLALFLISGGFLGLSVPDTVAVTLPACTTASVATCAVNLEMTSGGFGVHGNTPANLPGPAAITGNLNPSTGDITGATLSTLTYHESGKISTNSTETIIISQVNQSAGSGTIDYLGDVSYTATLQVLVTIHSPVKEQCASKPIDVVLVSPSPYASDAVTISQRNFTIPDFSVPPSGTCSLALTQLNSRYSGQVNEMSLSLEGALPLPPPPAKPTSTTLTVSPASPVLTGTPVTLKATVTATGNVATSATGHISFMSGPTTVGVVTISGGTATLRTPSLPVVPQQSLTAVYSGDSSTASSTSNAVPYSVQPKPSVSSNLPISVVRGTSAPASFTINLTNPASGENWPSLKLALKLTNISGQSSTNVTLTYENGTDIWCSLSLRHTGTIKGTFKGLTGACGSTTNFSLAAGSSLNIPFRITYGSGANVGRQTVLFVLETVTPTGTPVPPFTTATTTGVPTNAPYVASSIQVNPSVKYSVTADATPQSSIPQGYSLVPNATIVTPANTTADTIYYPAPSGEVRFLVDGHTLTPPVVTTTPRPIDLQKIVIPTSGLSVGPHTLTVDYSGDSVYSGAEVSKSFTVTGRLQERPTAVHATAMPLWGRSRHRGRFPPRPARRPLRCHQSRYPLAWIP